MKTFISTLILIITLPTMAQHGGTPQHSGHPQQMAPRANQGQLPPAPAAHAPNLVDSYTCCSLLPSHAPAFIQTSAPRGNGILVFTTGARLA